ncbi:MAG: hypothetical protein WA864_19170 [Acetobacteraceae bacterium]|jgi:hypothetical protein
MNNLPKRFVPARIAGLPAPELHDCASQFPALSQPRLPSIADAGRIRFGAGYRLPLGK